MLKPKGNWQPTPVLRGAPILNGGQRHGLFEGYLPGLFEGQRPGPIPAYGTAIGFGHRHDRRAESPVSCPVFMVNWMNRAFSPQDYHLRTKTSGDAQGWYHAAPLVLGPGMSNRPVRPNAASPVCSRANGPAPSQPMASP